MSTNTNHATGTGWVRWRRAWVSLIVLGALATGLAYISSQAGPRLREVTVDAELVASRSEQRVLLEFSQPIAPVDAGDIKLVPEAPFAVTSEGNALTLRFLAPLQSDTEYRITAQVRGTSLGRDATASAAFRSGDPVTRTLVRSTDGGDDRIMAHRLGSARPPEPEFAAPGIQEFASVGDALLVVTTDSNGSELRLQRSGALSTAPPLVRLDTLSEIHVDERSGLAGVIGSGVGTDGKTYDRTLFIVDLGSETALPATSTDGVVLTVDTWQFIPGSGSLVLSDDAHALSVLTPGITATLQPLETQGTPLPPLPGTNTVPLADADTPLRFLAFAEGEATATPEVTAAPATPSLLPALAEIVTPETGVSSQLITANSAVLVTRTDAGDTVEYVAWDEDEDDGEAAAQPITVFTPAAVSSRVTGLCVAPNRQTVAVTVTAADTEQPTTHYVRLSPLGTITSVIGGQSDWCD